MQEINLPSNSMMLSKDFLFGVATSSFQIEGDRKGRLDCIWDTFCEKKNAITDATNGDIACNHIDLWKQDVELIDSLGVDALRTIFVVATFNLPMTVPVTDYKPVKAHLLFKYVG